MSVYARILELARRQAEAARSDDVQAAVDLLDERGQLVSMAPPPSVADQSIISEILQLDKEIASAIRERMLAIRDEAVSMRHGRQALAGYTQPRARAHALDIGA